MTAVPSSPSASPASPAPSASPASPPFDVCGPLPGPGVTVLEASAGTGKTFTITALVARFVAAGTPLDAILAVTFTRMATGELRDRVRSRLVSAEDALGRYLASGEQPPAGDDVVAHLAGGSREEVEARHRRLADAVASFDAATIATTHGFCQVVLDGLGTAGDVPAGAALMEDTADLVDEVVDDLYLRWALMHGRAPGFTRAAARQATAQAVGNPGIDLSPPEGDDPDGLLRRLVAKAEAEVARRLQGDNLLTYDHLLSRLAGTLEDPERGPVARGRLRDRYQVVLVDEFQDTDPVQWRVVREAFGEGTTTLVLVGDPKQAIYSFRGADVHAYLDAARRATTLSLGVNWRTDQPLLDATEAMLSPLQMGHPEIIFRTVRAPADRQDASIRDFPTGTPIRFRLVDEHQDGIQHTAAKGLLQKGSLVDWIAGDVAADVSQLLEPGARIRDAKNSEWRAVVPADLAVLTRTNKQSVAVRDALRAAGVPSVIAGLDSVFASAAATDWLRLLEALEEPASRARAVAMALTPFVGMSATEAATAGERAWEAVHARAHRWSAVLAGYGVAALYRSVTATEGLPARVVGTVGGERQLTDLGHVAELLHAESAASQMGVPTLRAWLAQRIAEVETEAAGAEERSRRLDSDSEAVQVLTVHRAKGLEFGVVYCPYLWDSPPSNRSSGPVVFHDPHHGDARTLDVGCSEKQGPARRRYTEHRNLALAEQRGEDLRLMYVAITRARHQVVLWWGRADQSRNSPLGRLLMCRDARTGAVRDAWANDPSDKDVRAALGELLSRARPGLIAPEVAGGAGSGLNPPSRHGHSASGGSLLDAARFDRKLDLLWHRASYSSITAAAHDGYRGDNVGSEPESPGVGDEPAATEEAGEETAPASASGVPCPLGELPGGTEFGTFVHGLLEEADFAAPDLDDEIRSAVSARASWAGPALADADRLTVGLVAALSTPLGPLVPGVRLRDIARRDRVDELGFELPLAGGDQPVGDVSTADLAAVLAEHLAKGGPLAGYPARLADPLLAADLRGYLTGSLDLVFRRRVAGAPERWYVVDYKTNKLGGDPLTTWHYRPDALDAEMQRQHYPLQALLYLVALHRYLGWRLPGYSPDDHLGGVLYLFVRGMVGADTPVVDGQPAGVFSWAPPAALIVALSDLFSGRRHR